MTILVQTLGLGSGPAEIVVKDTIDVAGYPTKAGSRALEDAAPALRHATAVENLLTAGWRITGKTNLHELAFGTTGINSWTGTPDNPKYPGLVPGGSSSGSAAAVAAGLTRAALGTDTGGSIRTPAVCCGVFGFKPTYGRVSRSGVMPAASSLDCVGPLAVDMPTLIQVMQAIDPSFGEAPELAGRSIGLIAVQSHPDIHEALQQALRASGFVFADVAIEGMEAAYAAGLTLINAETWAGCGALLETGKVGADVAQRLIMASRTDAADVTAAERVRFTFAAEVDAGLKRFSVLALPTMADFPPLIKDAGNTNAAVAMTTLVRPFNLSGHPALTIPLLTRSGLPAGLQLVGARGADELVCAMGAEIARRLASLSLTGVPHEFA